MTKRFVVVGINNYTALNPSGKSNLNLCVADATSMADLLVNSFGFDQGESVTLTDQQASSSAITAALKSMIAKSVAGDVACFYYSGHGSRTPAAPDQADCDQFYESIVPASGPRITDRDLFKIADSLQPSYVNFTVILDSCHSGGMDQETDSVFKCRSVVETDEFLQRIQDYLRTLIPCGILIPEDSGACTNNVQTSGGDIAGRPVITEDPDKVLVDQAKTTLIAGCRFDELSWETSGHGLLTKAFLEIVNASNFEIGYSDLLDRLRSNVKDDFTNLILPKLKPGLPTSQTPQLRGQKNRVNDVFLSGYVDSR
jgi:hypothetical protein